MKELLDSSCQGVKRLFALAYNNTAGKDQVSVNSYKKYFLPILKLMEETFMINQLMAQLKNMTKLEKISTGQGNDYTTGCLLDFAYFEKITDYLQLI